MKSTKSLYVLAAFSFVIGCGAAIQVCKGVPAAHYVLRFSSPGIALNSLDNPSFYGLLNNGHWSTSGSFGPDNASFSFSGEQTYSTCRPNYTEYVYGGYQLDVFVLGSPGTAYKIIYSLSGNLYSEVWGFEDPYFSAATQCYLDLHYSAWNQAIQHRIHADADTRPPNNFKTKNSLSFKDSGDCRGTTHEPSVTIEGLEYSCAGSFFVTPGWAFSMGDPAVLVSSNNGSFEVRVESVSQLPVAVISQPNLSQYKICVGRVVRFDGSESHDPDNGTNPGDGIIAYKWYFRKPDGTADILTGAQVDYAWDSDGRYQVQLIVTDDEGAEGIASTCVEVYPARMSVSSTIAKKQTGKMELLGEKRCGCEVQEGDCGLDKDKNCLELETTNQCSIARVGCALACATMAINHYLGTNYDLEDINKMTHPSLSNGTLPIVFDNRTLGMCQAGEGRRKTNNINFNFVADLIELQSGQKYVVLPAGTTTTQIMENLYRHNVPIVIRITKGTGGTHFVFAHGFECLGERIDISIHDPGGSWQSLEAYKASVNGTVTKTYMIVPGTEGVYRATLTGAGELLAVDKEGRLTGYDPATNSKYNEIPNSWYCVVAPDSINDANSVSPDREILTKEFLFPSSSWKEISFLVLGTKESEARLVVEGRSPVYGYKVVHEESFNTVEGSEEPFFLQLPSCADFNMDGVVDMEDLKFFAGEWNQTGQSLASDLFPVGKGDGIVDFYDFVVFAQDWNVVLAGLNLP